MDGRKVGKLHVWLGLLAFVWLETTSAQSNNTIAVRTIVDDPTRPYPHSLD